MQLRGGIYEIAFEEWDAFVDRLSDEMTRRSKAEERSTAEMRPESYLKVEVYKFVSEFLDLREGQLLKDILESYRPTVILNRKPTFAENPFHWALFALRVPDDDPIVQPREGATAGDDGESKRPWVRRDVTHITKDMVWKIGMQLAYARKLQVPPEFLIGFIYQCGGAAVLSKQLAAQRSADRNVEGEHRRLSTADLAR